MRMGWMIGALAAGLMLAGCAGKRGAAAAPARGAETSVDGVLVVNSWCATDPGQPVSPVKIAPETHTRMWRGQRIGFCGSACAAAWDALRDEQRSAALGAAIKREQTEGRPAQP